MLNFSEIHEAYQNVAMFGIGEVKALISVEKEKVVFISNELYDDRDNIEALEKEVESGDWINLPSKYELGLGKKLVFRFAEENLSEADFFKVEDIFSRKGACEKWKNFLFNRNLLDAWYKFSNDAEVEALKNWLENNEIQYEDASHPVE